MAEPITWKNINAPTFAASNALMDKAADRLSAGLSGIQGELNARNERLAQAHEKEKTTNTNDLLARVLGTNNLEAHGKLSQELSPDALKGMNVDALKVMEALQRRDNTIRSDLQETDKFNQWEVGVGERDTVADAQRLIAEGNYDGAKQLLANTDMRGGTDADLLNQITQAEQVKEDRSWNKEQRSNTRAGWAHTQKQRDREYASWNDEDKRKLITRAAQASASQIMSDTNMSQREKINKLTESMSELGVPMEQQSSLLGSMRGLMGSRGKATQEETQQFYSELMDLNHGYQDKVATQNGIINQADQVLSQVPQGMEVYGQKMDTAGLINQIRKDMPLLDNTWGNTGTDTDNRDLSEQINTTKKEALNLLNEGIRKENKNRTDNKLPMYTEESAGAIINTIIAKAVQIQGRHDIDEDSGRGEIDFTQLRKKALSGVMNEYMGWAVKQADANNVKRSAQKVISDLAKERDKNQMGLENNFNIRELKR